MAATPNHLDTPASASPQERAAREFLAQGRFRKARDELKLLCKIDRGKFLPLLVEANLGLAREMAGKGMLAEAQQVLSYLKTIASAEQLLGVELELGAGSATARPGAGLEDVLKTLAKPGPAGSERQHLADWAVLAFEPVPTLSPEMAAPAQDLAAIVSALRAISERQFDQALEWVRPVGQASAFSHWKLFVKGLAAFHRGESERAARFFEGLPAGSAPGKASRSFLLLLGSPPVAHDSPLPPETAIEWACRIAGERGLGGPLLRAEQAWRKDNPLQMYQNLRGGIARFPGEGTDLIGVLSEFAVNCDYTLPSRLQGHYEAWMDRIIDVESPKNPVELQLFLRARLMAGAGVVPDNVAVGDLERFLRTREKLHGAAPALDSMAYGWLGEMFAKPPLPGAPVFFFPNQSRSRMRNVREAQRLLEKAVGLNEGNLRAGLSLCAVYRQLKQEGNRNRLLDRMTARFPEKREVLMLAGQACLERKAYTRALKYLDQALALDRLDPAIPDNLVNIRMSQAREWFQKSRLDDAREAMGQTAPFEVSTPDNLTRSRWCLRIQQGLMELTWGDRARGGRLLEEARRESPSEAACLYYAGIAEMDIKPGTGRGSAYFDEFVRVRKKEAGAAEAVGLTRIWLHGKERLADRLGHQPGQLLEDYLRAALKRPFSREVGRRLVEFCLGEDDFIDTGKAVVEKRLREDAGDPLFRLFRLRFRRGTYETEPEETRMELEEILAEATRRKDEETARQVRQQLEGLKNPPPMPRESFDDGSPPEDEFDGEGPPDFGGGNPAMGGFPGGMSSLAKLVFEPLIELLAKASERDLKRMRQTRPPGMSAADFDKMVEIARARRKPSNAGFQPGEDAPSPSRPPGSNWQAESNQPELFEP